MWRAAEAVIDADRVAVRLARLPGVTPEERINARLAAERLATAEVPVPDAPSDDQRAPQITIRVLGRFEVRVAGEPVASWRSQKARDLLRILVSRRGRVVPRDELAELLWNGEDPGAVAHRLSVALSTVRTTLDPGRQLAADHYVIAGSGSVGLDLTRVNLDIATYLLEAEHGLRLYERGELRDSRTVLAAAERAYTGDVFEDEPYDDWAVAIREEVRAVYLRVARTLVDLAQHEGQITEAVHYLHRILEKDPYDEQAHLDLIDALTLGGAYGEARRAQQRYLDSMRAIGISPVAARGPTAIVAGSSRAAASLPDSRASNSA